MPISDLILATVLPRGAVQGMHVSALSEQGVRMYHRELHRHDRFTWTAVLENRLAHTSEPEIANHPVYREFDQLFMRVNGFAHALAMPMPGALLPGYPGILYAVRGSKQTDFSEDEVRSFQQFAEEMAASLRQALVNRGGVDLDQPAKLFVFDQNGRMLNASTAGTPLAPALAERLKAEIGRRLVDERVGRSRGGSDRVAVPDEHGQLASFRVIVHRSFPAISESPVAVVCKVPEARHWALLRPGDFDADPELARLVPAIRFIAEHYARGPTLNEIAAVVQLSPFHFHRRFSELLGITPKHLLADLQVDLACRLLRSGEVELVEIARRCGFAHQSHFTSRFRQATGLTPTRWRAVFHSRHDPA
jgi:AraC-like DNA-binding protein